MNVVVVGANYGDCGKGRTVDFLAQMLKINQDKQLINVRFSGSNNAAHTVWHNGKSFVFHLLGAASFRGLPTYLSQHVVVDFVALEAEINEFEKITGQKPLVYVDPRCRVNLPYDVMKNRIKEILKGADKHGSTGNGLNETIDRHQSFPLLAGTFEFALSMLILTQNQFQRFVETELKNIELEHQHKDFIEFLCEKNSVSFIFEKIKNIINNHPQIICNTPELKNYNCIFEGSQGLALDEYSKFFPHVTRTRTGTTNVIDLCREHDIVIDNVYYVSRPYFSRHGADKYFEEFDRISDVYNIVDETNIPNDWQDDLKFGILNVTEMDERINDDFKVIKNLFPNVNKQMIFTCMDQCGGGSGIYIRNGRLYQTSDLINSLNLYYGFSDIKPIFFDNKENI